MCGIAGVLVLGERDSLVSSAQNMADALSHRGPDDGGVWADVSAGIALAHRRLSILDLSRAGHQPMLSSSGRYVVSFNGEIYNHLELRKRLLDITWQGRADTETLLAAIEKWGLDFTLSQVKGMFAFALWDRSKNALTLVRDRFGEKPLYYGWCGRAFVFASELKALRTFPGWRCEVDREALHDFIRFGYVPLPRSIYQGVAKLIPGAYVTVDLSDPAGEMREPVPYWRARDVAQVGVDAHTTFKLNDRMATDRLESLLVQSIRGQMMADVPVGLFLSGGVDSSVVAALMQKQSAEQIRTFSIGFLESGFDESKHAKSVAQHIGTCHTDHYLTADDALNLIEQLPFIYDEPFGDSSQIPMLLLAKLARQSVKVCLTGDGGDEVFAGYNRYMTGPAVWRAIQVWPIEMRRWVGGLLRVVTPAQWGRVGRLLPKSVAYPQLGEKLHKLSQLLDATDRDLFVKRLLAQGADESSFVIGGKKVQSWADQETMLLSHGELVEEMMFHDKVGYLVDDILTKVDRAAMSVGLETRVPFIDLDVVNFAAQLPMHMKIRDRQGKWLLRQVLYRYVPKELVQRRKQGFAVPLAEWLRGPLRSWAEASLDQGRLQAEGYFVPTAVRQRWEEHLSGRRNWEHWLWNVLMFQSWQERWR